MYPFYKMEDPPLPRPHSPQLGYFYSIKRRFVKSFNSQLYVKSGTTDSYLIFFLVPITLESMEDGLESKIKKKEKRHACCCGNVMLMSVDPRIKLHYSPLH